MKQLTLVSLIYRTIIFRFVQTPILHSYVLSSFTELHNNNYPPTVHQIKNINHIFHVLIIKSEQYSKLNTTKHLKL